MATRKRLHKIVNGKKHYLSAAAEKTKRAEWAASAAEKKLYHDTLGYRDERVRAYPAIGDQLDALWKIMQMFDDTHPMLVKILEIKALYPKPVSK